MIKKWLFVMVILSVNLVACGQDVLPPELVPTAPPSPATYQGVSLPPSQLVAESAEIPSAWLVVQGKAVHGTLLGYRVFTEPMIETDGQASIGSPVTEAPAPAGQPVVDTQGQATYGYVIYGHEPDEKIFVTQLDKVELATATLAAGEPAIIVAPTSATTFRARLVSVPLAAGGRSLKADGKTEGDAAVFTLQPTDYPNGRFLRVP